MEVDTRIFDQIYAILVNVRTELRNNYDNGQISKIDKQVFFQMNEGNCVEAHEEDGWLPSCTVSWDNNNSNLRTLTREVMHQLLA